MTIFLVIAVTTAALLAGAAWGALAGMGKRVEGFLVALAGGALIASLMSELIEPAADVIAVPIVGLWVLVGAVGFTGLDWGLEKLTSGGGGIGLALAVTFDGIPENLALGTALIGAGPLEVAALAGSIFLSNLPEAAGAGRDMVQDGWKKGRVMALWGGVAAILVAAALAGNLLLRGAPDDTLSAIRCVAAGAVVASLATEVFPGAFREDSYWTGVAVAIGLVLSLLLSALGG
ncbi:hypothetical protein [Wenxinia marina]|uniref:Divalent heavy-metal cations transporter n=1 Tax=Wenxinia marina DSM 24838 TaxID=1123501 RepID=A0A0D0QE94_9RHOB|nr:hypothetical protein [Wenxinia marina]KIQ70662.1 hypothetical protein Wenmar_01040 [Wenxinia marina DSM 24838]GGL51429.1 membrane protein [Wenxinia marina]